MRFILSLFIGFLVCLPCGAQSDLDEEFFRDLEKVEAKYRAGKAALIKKADRVVVYLVDFDGISDEDGLDGGDEKEAISIAPYGTRTKILSAKEIGEVDRRSLLDALSAAIAKPEHSGGAMCHFPIHGVRVFAGDELLHEGTFCWVCGNFSFSYPQGSGWLDTNADLKAIFSTAVPIPQSELDRFYSKYPGARPRGEPDGAGQSAKRLESKSEDGGKPQPEGEGRSQ